MDLSILHADVHRVAVEPDDRRVRIAPDQTARLIDVRRMEVVAGLRDPVELLERARGELDRAVLAADDDLVTAQLCLDPEALAEDLQVLTQLTRELAQHVRVGERERRSDGLERVSCVDGLPSDDFGSGVGPTGAPRGHLSGIIGFDTAPRPGPGPVHRAG